MYKSKLRQKIQQQTGLDDDILDFEKEKIQKEKEKIMKEQEQEEIKMSKKEKEQEERRMSKKRPSDNHAQAVPTSVRKHRRGEGGISAAMSTTSAVTNPMSDDNSFDGSNAEAI
jgi:outer membrane biosynthesis protein TonB